MKLSVFSILLIISSSLFSQSKKNNYGLDSAIGRLDSSLTLLQQIVKYTKEQNDSLIFPEIDIDKVNKITGLDITFVTTANTNEEAFELLKELGMPFKNIKK